MGSSILREQMAYESIVGHRLPWDCISLRCSTALWIRSLGRRLGNLLRNVKIAISKRQEPHLKGSRRMIITDVGDSSSDDDDDESDENVKQNEYQQQEQQQQHIQEQEIMTVNNNKMELSRNHLDQIEHHNNDIDCEKHYFTIEMNKNDNIQLTDKSTIDINKQESSLNVCYNSNVDTNNNEDIITTFDNADMYCHSEVNEHLENDEVSICTYSIVDYEELKQKGNESFKKVFFLSVS
ncbi:unnamed protein product [Schistosoma margrebowiei]|uniref:Uncharacterized protein n=1 Tax=Schistosoma margrebowiei TaxID=48269 RepID=A0A183NCI9_9TREM|nr:unnamed protein product [Schistosoma margrebowiei]